jgi:hypothetical protein
MIKSRCHRVVSAKAIGSSGDHLKLVVQTFDGPVGDLSFSSEPIEKEDFVRAKHARHFAHRLDPAAQRALTLDRQEGGGLSGGAVGPEVLEGFLEHPSPARGQLAAQELVESAFGEAADTTAAA